MTHHRTKIREAVVDLLKGATSAGMNVFPSRIGPLWNMPLPLILIYLRDETVSPISSLPKPRERKPQLAIEVRANAADETAEATLDSIAAEIEQIMDANPRLRGTVQSSGFQSTEMDLSAIGDKPIAAARLTYGVTYEE
ncbi:MAG: hypothetical protein A2428_03110 [Bdellovibrionales bacterium RIFOXYC1_FULL_54_43]|nr:MAG: hypothetical protein A2428_03110 [Bdellovibrionales bacterium RIFOXYC1_FULL_54_43]OFZ82670.1 MAG: hypothetical protein A2603_02545 [Bdellovibrionales bacterium RIFOXYD1_FULL_55_31]